MSTRRASSLLVGREAELRALDTAVDERRLSPVVIVAGEAGVGKTRLVAEFLAARVSSGSTSTVGSCLELGADLLPYAPFVEAVGAHLESLEALPPEIDALLTDLAPLVPHLAPVRGAAEADDRDGLSAPKGRMYEAVRRLLDTAPAPFLLILEDLHWADRSTLELLSYLARRLRNGSTAIIATVRTDDLHRRHPLVPVLAELERSGRATRVDLERLGTEEVAILVREIRGDAPASVVAAISRRSQGNPFLAEELLAIEAGAHGPIPATLRDLLLARIAQLSDPARAVLAIVAAVGRPTDAELLAAVWEHSPRELEIAIREAVERSILVVDPAARVVFRHALIGEAVADELLPGERMRIHAALARALAARPDLASATAAGSAAEIAHHLYAARDLPSALRASVAAADAAVAARAFPEARDLYERALELLDRTDGADPGMDEIRLLDAAAEANFHSGEIVRAISLGSRAVELSGSSADVARTGYLLGRLVEWTELSGDFDRITELAERAVSLVPESPPSRERAHALIGLASSRGHAGRARECLVAARAAVEVAETCGAAGEEAIARSNVASALAQLGRDREAVEAIEGAAVVSARSRGAEETSVVETDRAVIRASAGCFAGLRPILEEVRQSLEREGALEVHEPWVATAEAELLVWEGRWTEAEELTTRVTERAPASPLAAHLVIRGRLRARMGRTNDGARDLEQVMTIRPVPEASTRADAAASLAEIALLEADPRTALARVADGLALLATTDEMPVRVHLLALGLQAAADIGERGRARRDRAAVEEGERAGGAFAGALARAAAGGLVPDGGVEGRVLARVLWGRAEDARRHGDDGADLWARAADALDEAGEPYLATRCRVVEAERLISSRTGRDAGIAVLRAAFEWAERVGARPLATLAADLARRARVDLSVGPELPRPDQRALGDDDPYRLSAREREVLALLVDGRTNREIGELLFIAEKTASVHVTHILDKLGVSSRGAAVAVAVRGGLLAPAPGTTDGFGRSSRGRLDPPTTRSVRGAAGISRVP